MFRGYVLRYLALAGSGDSPASAREAIPVFFRFFVLRRARALVIAAGFETASDDEAHVHRLAYLRAAGTPALVDPSSIDDVQRAFEAGRQLGVEKHALTRVLAVSIGAVHLVLLVVLTYHAVHRDNTAALPLSAAAPAPDREEAAPEPVHPLSEHFRTTLPAYAVALDARGAGRERPPPHDVASARASVLSSLQQTSPRLVPSMTGLLDAAEAYSSRESDDAVWLERLVSFHDACEDEGAPFYVDAQLTSSYRDGRRRVLLSTYRIAGRRTFFSGDRRIVSLDIERLDSLNYEQSLLGYTRPETRYALVLVDRIERFLVSQLLPSMHGLEEAVFVRGYEDEHDTHWVTPFETQAHEDLRDEARRTVARSRITQSALDELADAVVRRRRAIADISFSLRTQGIALRAPETYAYDMAGIAEFRRLVDSEKWQTAELAQRAVATRAMRRVYEALSEAHRTSVAEHECQHRLDYEDDRLVAVPRALADYTGETRSEDRVNRMAERSNAELSAYLSQVARQPELARTNLIHIAAFLMNRESWGMPESYAAVVLFESIAAQAGIGHGPIVANHRIVRSQIARIYGELRTRDGNAISDLARRAWSSLYGGELPPLRR